MKHFIEVKKLRGAGLAAAAIMLLACQQTAGAVSSNDPILYFKPSATSVRKNDTLTVEVRIDTQGQDIWLADPTFSYPADKLEYVSMSGIAPYGASDFRRGSPGGGDGYGTVYIDRADDSGVNGDKLITVVTFKALASEGTAELAIKDHAEVQTLANKGTQTYSPYVATRQSLSFTAPPGANSQPATVSFGEDTKLDDLNKTTDRGSATADDTTSKPKPATADTASKPAANKQPGGKPWLWMGLGVAGLLLVAAGTWWAIKRHKRRAAATGRAASDEKSGPSADHHLS